MSYSDDLSNHHFYGYFKERSQRAQSPVREEVTKMSPQDLEKKLNVTISKNWFGRYNEKDVEIARRIFEKTKPKSESPESRVFIPFIPSENSPSNRPYSPSDFKNRLYKPVVYPKNPKNSAPRKTITKADIDKAKDNYQRWKNDALSIATTNKLVAKGYDVLAVHRDLARIQAEKLAERLAKLKFRLFHGGKSKRVKSKRNKRSTKRRNARK